MLIYMPEKYHTNDLFNFCAIYDARNADNATTFRKWTDSKH